MIIRPLRWEGPLVVAYPTLALPRGLPRLPPFQKPSNSRQEPCFQIDSSAATCGSEFLMHLQGLESSHPGQTMEETVQGMVITVR
jgi:hypothetical protein